MPHTKSAAKRAEQNVDRRTNNRATKSTIHTLSLKLAEMIEAGDKDKAMKAFSAFVSGLDKAAKTGVIAENNASRRKARGASALKKIKA
jgi:small subunit ribosomal protein S20